MTRAELHPVLPRVGRGDDEAVRECLRRYGNLVHSIAWRFLRDAPDVEDACQEIFLALWRSASSFDPSRASEATFVAMVARRRLIDRQRAAGTRPLPLLDAEPEPRTSALETYVDARNVVAAIAGCSDDQKRVILMSAVEGLTHDEISRALSMPLGTVKSHYARGIERLKRALMQGEADR